MTKQISLFSLLILLQCCNSPKNTESAPEEQKPDTVLIHTSPTATSEEPSTTTFPDHFHEALILLDAEFGYQSQTVSGDSLYIMSDKVDPKLIEQFTSCANQNPRLEDIDFGVVKGVKKTMVKSKKTLDGMYLKVDIQEWQFESDSTAIEFKMLLDEVAMDDRECINKGGILWWQIGDKLYLMTTPAFRFFFEFDEIKAVLDQKLK